MPYASKTRIPVEKSQVELERLLAQHGATQFYRGSDGERAVIGFKLEDRVIKFILPLPPAESSRRSSSDRREQLARERWRALLLSVKAKLVGVEAGIETLEEAFLAHVVTANGRTVHEEIRPHLAQMYSSGKQVPLLPGLGETSR